jgi:chromosome segregation protein
MHAMTLKRLEMHGFKSFAKKAVFDFSAPVTAIVGPNGSGKSNVVESIRFVLGEQSTKSLRSKSGADLIFKGSGQIGKMSRASVSITFDNAGRIFSLPTIEDQNLSLDFDEITITREVFADGGNKYSLNGNEVRLKDIHELIASVNIGSSGHHIISQGEADRLLNSKPAERREMLEESLGLKLYHYRIKESERKLEKTREHMREAESIRRELAPHIKFLKKQVEKIEKAREIEIALQELYGTYLVQEQSLLARKQGELQFELGLLEQQLADVEQELSQVTKSDHSEIQKLENEINETRALLRDLARNRDDIGRQMGRVEGMIESATRIIPAKQGSASVAMHEIEALINELEQGSFEIPEIIARLKSFIASKKGSPETKITVDTSEFEATKRELEQQIAAIDAQVIAKESTIQFLESQIVDARLATADRERAFYTAQARKNELTAKQSILQSTRLALETRAHALIEEYIQGENFVGSRIIDYKNVILDTDVVIDEQALRAMHHDIERMKIRLEDMGGGGGGDVIAEFDETAARDQFLEQQINDLTTALTTLESTIKELKEKLGKEFHAGIVKINKEFETFFRLMFGGGDAKLAIVDIEKRKKKSELDEEGNEIESTPSLEDDLELRSVQQGIDIDVSLPRKKVKDLEMLSGGERSLTSIALLFALSQVNPPPFLVLDETDAALDEANSQKYGDMIENLAKQTQLVVVTHNRETMSRADILYGVTLGSDDCSTLLSIKFEEAVKVAK